MSVGKKIVVGIFYATVVSLCLLLAGLLIYGTLYGDGGGSPDDLLLGK